MDIQEKLTNWKNEPTIGNLKRDITAAEDSFAKELKKIDIYSKYIDGGPQVNPIKKKSSKYRPKLIRNQVEWKIPSLEEPFLSAENMYRLKPRTFEDVRAAKQNQSIINYQWDTKVNKVKFVGDSVRSALYTGTTIAKLGWNA
jgi:hypothetical protein